MRRSLFGINDGFGRTGVDRAAGTEAGGDDTVQRVAGADGAHHVVAAAGADEDVGAQIKLARGGGLELAGRLMT